MLFSRLLAIVSAGEVELHLIVWCACLGECHSIFLNRQIAFSNMKLSNNRSVMPLDVLGDTRVTMKLTTCYLIREDWEIT